MAVASLQKRIVPISELLFPWASQRSTSASRGGDVNCASGSGIIGEISGRLSLGGATRTFGGDSDLYLLAKVSDGGSAAGIVKTGSGWLSLYGSNSLTGAVLVNGGTLSVSDNHGLGASSGGVMVADGALLTLYDVVITNETLTLNGSGLDYPHYGAFFGSGTNDWTGTVVLASDSVIVTLNLASFLESIAGLGGNGVVLMGNGTFTVGTSGANSVFAGEVLAAGGNFIKAGAGQFRFAGTGTNSGFNFVNLTGGALHVDSTLTATTFASSTGTKLSGDGVISAPLFISGDVSPGGSPGKLRTGSASFSATAKFSVELNDVVPGTGFDQLAVTGGVSLGGSELVVATNSLLSSNRTFIIIANDSSDAVLGQFAGLPEGGSFISGKREFLITYTGGDGNEWR